MNAILKVAAGLLVAAAAVPAMAGRAPYESACTKALHMGKSHHAAPAYVQRRVYVQPQMVQPRVTVAPQVATTPRADQGRRTFSYEPAAPVMAAPAYVAPRTGGYRAPHTWENATMKGLGQFR